MLLAVALLESHIFTSYFFVYDSNSSSHACSFSMGQSWEGVHGHSQGKQYADA